MLTFTVRLAAVLEIHCYSKIQRVLCSCRKFYVISFDTFVNHIQGIEKLHQHQTLPFDSMHCVFLLLYIHKYLIAF